MSNLRFKIYMNASEIAGETALWLDSVSDYLCHKAWKVWKAPPPSPPPDPSPLHTSPLPKNVWPDGRDL